MTYRPTVRYNDMYKKYVDQMFHATHLDRSQIIRAALFAAAHSKEFQSLMNQYQKRDVPLPSPLWSLQDADLWRDLNPETVEERRDVYAKKTEPAARRTGEVSTPVRTSGGGIRKVVNQRDQSGEEKRVISNLSDLHQISF